MIPVHKNKNSDKVLYFISIESLKNNISEMIENGNMHSLYCDKNGNIIAKDIWQKIHKNITKK
jgi:hypothetical protein